jgi:NADH pyrophosphatase NudC (nudix superfamily)
VQDDGIKRNSELEDARWFSPSELAELDPLYPITRQALELYDARLAECSP